MPWHGEGVFVGRGREAGLLRSLVEGVVAGRGGCALLEGEPGIGKSSLLAVVAGQAEVLGCRVLRAVGDDLSQRFPLRALVDALAQGYVAWLAQPGAPGDPIPAAVERLSAHIDRLCATSPVVLIFDDLQWADEASLLAWHRLSQAVQQLPLLLIAAARPVPRRPAFSQLRRALIKTDAVVVKLGPLPADDVDELARHLAGGTPGPSLRQLIDRAGGNPLYLREIMDSVVREGLLAGRTEVIADIPAASIQQVPASLADAIGERLGFLSESTARMLRMAALHGEEFSLTDLSTSLGQEPMELLDAIDEARHSGVISGSGPRLSFRHPLIREALYVAIPVALRAALHYQVARSLASAQTSPDQVARQLLAAEGVVDNWMFDWLVDHVPDLADRAPEIASELLQRAVDHMSTMDPRRDLLAAVLAELMLRLGWNTKAVTVARQALAHPVTPDLRMRLIWSLASALPRTSPHNELSDLLTKSIADPELPPEGVARLRALKANFLFHWENPGASLIAAKRALEEAERVGDDFAIAFALSTIGLVNMISGANVDALDQLDRGVAALGDRPQDTFVRHLMLHNKVSTLMNLDRIAEARALYDQVITAQLGPGGVAPTPLFQMAGPELMYWSGDWDDAISVIESMLALGLNERRNDIEVIWLRGLGAIIASHRDDRPTVEAHIKATPACTDHALLDGTTYLLLARALLAERAGDIEEAIHILAPAMSKAYETHMSLRYKMFPDLVRLLLANGNSTGARAASETAATIAATEALPEKVIPALRCQGLVDTDPEPLSRAVDIARAGATLPLRLANTLEDNAVVLAHHDHAKDARASFLEAVDIYQELGATWDITRAEARMRTLGIRRGVRGSRQRPSKGWESLTPTELKVANLVARGLSNPDIGVELYLSRRTVQTHVSHILAKLLAHSRGEIMRIAAERQAAV